MYSSQSSFTPWPDTTTFHHHAATKGTSQCLLKYIIFSVPSLHTKPCQVNHTDSGRKGTSQPQEEPSANHVLAERRRREKLNERFVLLRSLVPSVTKKDKASILGDTIEYVKQLRQKVEDLEGLTRQMVEVDQWSREGGGPWRTTEKRKMSIVEESGGARPRAVALEAALVEVSIIESDALVELECPYREGVLLDVMMKVRELRLEITTVHSSLNNGVFVAEMRAKVMDKVSGEKVTIMGVKREIKEIISQIDLDTALG